MPPGTERWQVSSGGGRTPAWGRDSRELFYPIGQKMLAVDVHAAASFSTGVPHMLFPVKTTDGPNTLFAVTPDGQRFLVPIGRSVEIDSPIIVVQNWWVAMGKKK